MSENQMAFGRFLKAYNVHFYNGVEDISTIQPNPRL